MRVFVTGGTGFLGRRILRRLVERGDAVSALVRPNSDAATLDGMGVTVVRGALEEPESFLGQVEGADVVYHAGALVRAKAPWDAFYRANVAATEKLLDLACNGGMGRFVHVSSLGIFDIERSGVSIGEEGAYDRYPALRGNYTRAKIQADRLAVAAARTGGPVVIVRPGVLYGHGHPDEPIFLGRVHRWLRPDLLMVVGTPSYRVPICYVENAADAVVLAGTREGVVGHAFDVIDDPDLTQSQYFRLLGEARGNRLRVLYVPVAIFSPALTVVDRLHRAARGRPWSVAYQLERSGMSARYDTTAARSVLGWEPRVGVRDALAAALAA